VEKKAKKPEAKKLKANLLISDFEGTGRRW
jgi:hypothetical protein